MTTLTRARQGSVATVAALTLGLAACGSGAEVTEVADASQGAPESGATTDGATTGTGQAQAGDRVPVEDLLERLKSPGAETLSSFEMSMELAGGGEQVSLEGTADLAGETAELDVMITMAEMGEMQLILADGEAYIAMPPLTPQGKFFAVPASELDDLVDGGITKSLDFESTWEGWDVGAQAVRFVGSEQVRGEQMDHYAVVVDTAAAAEALGEAAGATEEMPLEGMPAEVTYDVWVDAQDLMRQLSFEMEGGSIEMSIDSWGQDFDITVPAPGDVMEMPAFGG